MKDSPKDKEETPPTKQRNLTTRSKKRKLYSQEMLDESPNKSELPPAQRKNLRKVPFEFDHLEKIDSQKSTENGNLNEGRRFQNLAYKYFT